MAKLMIDEDKDERATLRQKSAETTTELVDGMVFAKGSISKERRSQCQVQMGSKIGLAELIKAVCCTEREVREAASPQRVASVDHQRRPGHVPRGVAGQIYREWADLVGLSERPIGICR